MKILITGANGMLAKEVKEKFEKGNEIILTDVAELDITNEQAVMDYIKNTKPDYIINCAAYTAVDKAEENFELADRINGDGPANLAKAAKTAGAKLVHVSTDYVFGGNMDIAKDYKEDDAKAPVTAYGKTKLHGEKGIEENMDEYYIFRTAWLYGVGGNNFVKTKTKLGSTRNEINVVARPNGSLPIKAIARHPTIAANAVDVNTEPIGIPSSSPNIVGLTARIYDIVRNVVIPATISVRIVV